MTNRRRWIAQLPALLATVCTASPALADGKFFRRLDVADEPGIRAQRAVVAFRDGIETLIVQSDVAGAGNEFAWVLPLPAEPTAIEACPANTLTALNTLLPPHIKHFPHELVVLAIVAALLAVGFCHLRLRARALGRQPLSIVTLFAALAFLWLFASLCLPTTMGRARATAGVDVLQQQRAGIYDITVIRGAGADAVERWLTSNGFACSPSARGVIDAYTKDQWCFLTAKVASDAGEGVTHHPLKVAFPIAEPIYPMRLTGVDEGVLQLDLYVIGEQEARVSRLNTWLSDSVFLDAEYGRPRHWDFGDYVNETPPVFAGNTVRFRLGLPAVSALMWPDCVLTRLHGRLRAADMREDLEITWRPVQPMRATLYSRDAAISQTLTFGVAAIALATLGFTLAASPRGLTSLELLRRRGIVIILMGAAVAVGRYATLDAVRTQSRSRTFGDVVHSEHEHRRALARLSFAPPTSPFPDAYRALLDEQEDSKPSSAPATSDGGPGDFSIEATTNGWRLTIIDELLVPISIPISSNGVPVPAPK